MRETYKKKAEKLWKAQKRRIKDLTKRGYIIEELKPLPKKIGKKEYLRLEKELTLDNLYNNPKNFYLETNSKGVQRLVSARRGRELEKSRAGKKAAITRKRRKEFDGPTINFDWYEAVINGIYNQIAELETLTNSALANILRRILGEAIRENGRNETAQRIFDEEREISFLIGEILKPSPRKKDNSYFKIHQFAEILKGGSLSRREKKGIEEAYNFLDEIDEEEY